MTEPTSFAVGGATVTLDTPSAQMVRASVQPVTITDELGRAIVLKKPSPLANLDFAKAAGGSGPVNQLYLAEVAHLKFVASIDGEAVLTPASEGELRALYSRLSDEGNEAAQRGVFEHFVPKDFEEQVKNS